MSQGQLKIYALTHPETGELRYVGATEFSLEKRLRVHINESVYAARSGDSVTPKQRWVADLVAASTPPKIVLLEENAVWFQSVTERRWIVKLLNEGARLFNVNMTAPTPDATPYEYAEIVRSLRDVGLSAIVHIRAGFCPGEGGIAREGRDPGCDACKVLVRADRFLGVSP